MVRPDPNANMSTFDVISGRELYGPRQLRTGKRHIEGRNSTASSVVLAFDPLPSSPKPSRVTDKTLVFNSSNGVRDVFSYAAPDILSAPNEASPQLSNTFVGSDNRPMSPYAHRLRQSNGVADAMGSHRLASPSFDVHGYLNTLSSPHPPQERDNEETGFGTIVLQPMAAPRKNTYHNSTSSDSMLSSTLSPSAASRIRQVPMAPPTRVAPPRATGALNSTGYIDTVLGLAERDGLAGGARGDMLDAVNEAKQKGDPYVRTSSTSLGIAGSRKRGKQACERHHSKFTTQTQAERAMSIQNAIAALAELQLHTTSSTSTSAPALTSVDVLTTPKPSLLHLTNGPLTQLLQLSQLLQAQSEAVNQPRVAPNKLGHGRGRGRAHTKGSRAGFDIVAPPPETPREPRRKELLPQQRSTVPIAHDMRPPSVLHTPFGPNVGIDVSRVRNRACVSQNNFDQDGEEVENEALSRLSAQEQRFGRPVDLRTIPVASTLPYKEAKPRNQIHGVSGSIALAQFPFLCMGAPLPTSDDVVSSNTQTDIDVTADINPIGGRFIPFSPSGGDSGKKTKSWVGNHVGTETQTNFSPGVSQCMVPDTIFSTRTVAHADESAVTHGAPFASKYSICDEPLPPLPLKDNFITGEYVSPDPDANRYTRTLPTSSSAFQFSELHVSSQDDSSHGSGGLRGLVTVFPRPNAADGRGDSLEGRAKASASTAPIFREQNDLVEAQRMAFKFAKPTAPLPYVGTVVSPSASRRTSQLTSPSASRPQSPFSGGKHRFVASGDFSLLSPSSLTLLPGINESKDGIIGGRGSEAQSPQRGNSNLGALTPFRSRHDPFSFDRQAVEKPRPMQPTPEILAQREAARWEEEREKAARAEKVREREAQKKAELIAAQAARQAQIEADKQSLIRAQALAQVEAQRITQSQLEAKKQADAKTAKAREEALANRPLSPSMRLNNSLSALHSLMAEPLQSKHYPEERVQPAPTDFERRNENATVPSHTRHNVYAGLYDTLDTDAPSIPLIPANSGSPPPLYPLYPDGDSTKVAGTRQSAAPRKLKSKASKRTTSKMAFHETLKEWN